MKIKTKILEWIFEHSSTLREIAYEDCPYYEECGQSYLEEYEPMRY